MSRGSEAVKKRRKRVRSILVQEHGGICVDCGYVGPDFMFDFDHRVPADKEFGLSTRGFTRAIETMRTEAEKCDLVCCMCHRWRTHRQRCIGCSDCAEG